VAASKHQTVSSLLVFPIVYTRPWLMEMEEKPVPTEVRQRTFGPSAGHAALTFSDEMPSRFGPRHWGQSAAGEVAASIAAAVIKLSFIAALNCGSGMGTAEA
jgi:hypothetical protein